MRRKQLQPNRCGSILSTIARERSPDVFTICPQCGDYSEEKTIDTSGPFAICPSCGYAHPFKRLPLFVVTGASGSGKSTIGLALAPLLRDCILMER